MPSFLKVIGLRLAVPEDHEGEERELILDTSSHLETRGLEPNFCAEKLTSGDS
jgi:hypothetical protein